MKKLLTSILWFILGLTLLCVLLVAVAYVIYHFQVPYEETACAPLIQMAARLSA